MGKIKNVILTCAVFGVVVCCFFSLASGTEETVTGRQAKKSIPELTAEELAAMARQYEEVAVTRWVDYGGLKPMPYAEWKSRAGAPSPFTIQLASKKEVIRDGVKMCIIVNSLLYDDILVSLDQYVDDLTAEGHNVEVHTTSGGTPEDLRAFLQGKYTEGMEGCLLIGDLPVVWYETECWDPAEHEEFPCDLYYMDLDGTFYDGDFDGLYDDHSGDVAPEIWVGRLTPSPLSLGGMTEAELLENYFRKNHLYRTGMLPVTKRGLSYIDDDWIPSSATWDANHGLTYADRTFISDGAATIDTDYEMRLDEIYESILLCAHSSPTVHHFKIGEEWTGGYTFNTEVIAIDPVALFYNLFACSNARYISSNYMGGWYIFCESYGLASVGSTKTGAMLNFNYYYSPLGSCAMIGEAFRDWFAVIASFGYSTSETCWHYGMTLLGDPTLRALVHRPIEISADNLLEGQMGESYTGEIPRAGGKEPLAWQLVSGSLPSGLTLDEVNGVITGTPGESGDFNFVVSVSDACTYTDLSDERELSLWIHPPCGDFDGNPDINILDIVYLINFIYKNGPEPEPMNNADVDNEPPINILDIVYMINYIYKNGPAPNCP